jgi:hypothetical protein
MATILQKSDALIAEMVTRRKRRGPHSCWYARLEKRLEAPQTTWRSYGAMRIAANREPGSRGTGPLIPRLAEAATHVVMRSVLNRRCPHL